MRTVLIALLALGAEAVRLAVFARVPGHPDPFLGITVLVALHRPGAPGAVTGFLLGLIRDVTYGQTPGLAAFPLTAVGWAAGGLGKVVYREALVTQFLVITAGGLLQEGLGYLLSRPESPGGVFSYLLRVGGMVALSTALLVPVAWRVLRPALDRMLLRYERTFVRHGR